MENSLTLEVFFIDFDFLKNSLIVLNCNSPKLKSRHVRINQRDTNVSLASSRVASSIDDDFNSVHNSEFDLNRENSSSLYENLNQCDYFDVAYIPDCDANRTLFLLHLNIRSLQKHHDNLCEFVCALSCQPHIVCISETRITNKPIVNISLPGYSFYHANSSTTAGGVGIYVSNNLHHEETSFYNLSSTVCENLWLVVTCPFSKKEFVIGSICRHPSSKVQPFIDCLSESLSTLNDAYKNFFILGDINIDISPETITCMNNNYLNMLAEHGVVTLINKPTRIASTSATTIDHILTNVLQYQLFPGVINYDLTDHLPVFVKASCCIKKSYKYDKPVRSLDNFNPEQFREDLLERMNSFYGNFQNIFKNNIEYFFSEFHFLITSTIDDHAPLPNLGRKQKRLRSKPWLTKGLLTSIKDKQAMYKSHYVKGSSAEKYLRQHKFSCHHQQCMQGSTKL